MKALKKYSEIRELSSPFSANRDILFFKSLFALFHVLLIGGVVGVLIFYLY